MKTLPRSGDLVPAIGLGTFLTFDRLPGADRDDLRDVIRAYWNGGARVIDTSPLYGTAEHSVGAFATSLGITDQVIFSGKIWSTGEFAGDESHALRSLEQSKGRLWRNQIDIMHCHSLTNVDNVVSILRAWKKEGRIRYVGVSHHENLYHDALASWIERDVVDFVQVNYSIFKRHAEERVLPAAADRGSSAFSSICRWRKRDCTRSWKAARFRTSPKNSGPRPGHSSSSHGSLPIGQSPARCPRRPTLITRGKTSRL